MRKSNRANRFPKVFIVILNYNGKGVLRNCLSSVFRIDYPDFEVVVVDNNSEDGSLEEAKNGFSRANFIKNETNRGFSSGNNIGIRFSLERMADYVLLLNNDTVVEKDFLKKLVFVSEKEGKIGINCPLILENDRSTVWFGKGRINWWRMKTVHEKKVLSGDYYSSEFISGCSMLIKASVFRKIGLLDENFFLYWEDADFSFRAQKAGFMAVVTPGSRIVHLEKSEKNKNKVYWLVLSGLIFFKKNSSPPVRLWLFFYIKLRKMKNWLDRKKRSETAQIVYKAYKDFQNAGF